MKLCLLYKIIQVADHLSVILTMEIQLFVSLLLTPVSITAVDTSARTLP